MGGQDGAGVGREQSEAKGGQGETKRYLRRGDEDTDRIMAARVGEIRQKGLRSCKKSQKIA